MPFSVIGVLIALPNAILSFSASVSKTFNVPMSFVIFFPPNGIVIIYRSKSSLYMDKVVVPAPKSINAQPKLFSLLVSNAAAVACAEMM